MPPSQNIAWRIRNVAPAPKPVDAHEPVPGLMWYGSEDNEGCAWLDIDGGKPGSTSFDGFVEVSDDGDSCSVRTSGNDRELNAQPVIPYPAFALVSPLYEKIVAFVEAVRAERKAKAAKAAHEPCEGVELRCLPGSDRGMGGYIFVVGTACGYLNQCGILDDQMSAANLANAAQRATPKTDNCCAQHTEMLIAHRDRVRADRKAKAEAQKLFTRETWPRDAWFRVKSGSGRYLIEHRAVAITNKGVCTIDEDDRVALISFTALATPGDWEMSMDGVTWIDVKPEGSR